MKFLESIKAWWSEKIAAHRQSSAKKREARMERESCSDIQVLEFNGKVYIAHDGVPVVRVENLKDSGMLAIAEVLTESRTDLINWRKKFDRYA